MVQKYQVVIDQRENGIANMLIGDPVGSGVFYPSAFFDDKPDSNQLILSVVILGTKVKFERNFIGSIAYVHDPPRLESIYIINRIHSIEGLQQIICIIGTVSFNPNSRRGTFLSDSEITLEIGDVLEIYAPLTADSLLLGPSITLSGMKIPNG